MAKKEHRIVLGLQCTVCSSQNYITEKNKLNTPDRMTMKKYCPKCRKHTDHKEMKKLK